MPLSINREASWLQRSQWGFIRLLLGDFSLNRRVLVPGLKAGKMGAFECLETGEFNAIASSENGAGLLMLAFWPDFSCHFTPSPSSGAAVRYSRDECFGVYKPRVDGRRYKHRERRYARGTGYECWVAGHFGPSRYRDAGFSRRRKGRFGANGTRLNGCRCKQQKRSDARCASRGCWVASVFGGWRWRGAVACYRQNECSGV